MDIYEKVNSIVEDMVKEHEGGKVFFDNLDKSLQDKAILSSLFSKLWNSTKETVDYIIVSGKFGRFVNNFVSNGDIIVVKGGLRSGEEIDDISFIELKDKNVVFIDDSFYSGRTRDVIQREIERLGGNFIGTTVVYDGSRTKEEKVNSLYRYYGN